jgi:hypothetical protein
MRLARMIVAAALASPLVVIGSSVAQAEVAIGDFVWNDLDGDGLQDAGEPGAPGVLVQLWNAAKTQLLDQTTTDGNGHYSLTGPTVPGQYRVRAVLPLCAAFSPKDVGLDDTVDSDINPSGTNLGFTDVIDIASGVISTANWDIGMVGTPLQPPCRLGDRVWNDTNRNGVQDVGEPGRAGVTLQLWNSTKTALLQSTITDELGGYGFNVPTGSYHIRALLPTGAVFSPKDATTDVADSDVNPSGGSNVFGFTDLLSVPPSSANVDVGIASLNPPPPPEPPPPPPGPGPTVYVPLTPARVLDTRPGGSTVDSQFAGIGRRNADSVLELLVGGRGGVPSNASAVMLNVTVEAAGGDGFATVFPCGQAVPVASNLNYVTGQTVANSVAVKLGAGGKVCLTPSTSANMIVDAAGYMPVDSPYVGLTPARLADSRPAPTVDTLYSNTGPIPADGTLALTVVGRGGVAPTAQAAVVNVTATGPSGSGFLTVYPCGQPRPNASNVNFVAGRTVPNLVIATIGAAGQVCIYASVATDVIVDVSGFLPGGVGYVQLVPARLHDSRPASTIDGQHVNTGRLPADTVYVLPVIGRGGIPANSTAVVLNVTAGQPGWAGFATVYPCGQPVPNASNLNFVADQTVANAVVAKVGAGGAVCIIASSTSHFIVDVSGAVVPAP